MVLRILAIALIFVCTTVAWMILGSTIFARAYSHGPGLKEKVESSWGAPQEQGPPVATNDANGLLPLDSSKIVVSLDLDHRQKGLLWYSTYRVEFAGTYAFRNDSEREQLVAFTWKFPAEKAVYDAVTITLDGKPLATTTLRSSISGSARMAPGGTAVLKAGYRSQGLDVWRYSFGPDVSQVRDFTLTMQTNFRDIDFPDNSLSPTEKQPAQDGWRLSWDYRNLVSGYNIAMTMPAKLQPGPLAGEISYFAPVSLFFFFFVLFIITALRGNQLHPMNYFFLAAAFFAFHLLLAYLVDHISIHLSFVICSVVSIALVVSYLRLVAGIRFAAREAGLAQLVYLVLFSYAFFFKGFTGLTVTIGAIVTLFVVMQATGRIDWARQFSGESRVAPPTPA